MKFRSRKDLFFQVILNGACLLVLLVLFSVIPTNNNEPVGIVASAVLIFVIIFIQWVLYGTNYELTNKSLKYRSAFFKGAIPLNKVTELIVGETMWAGFKPATARNGIIVKYGKFSEIYISPDSNETFVKRIKELNSEIKITSEND